MFKWLDKIPMHMVALPAALLGMAPFFPEPHLWEKLKMLATGSLQRPIDIFDLLMHGVPLILLAIKLIRGERKAS
ncbi:MAG: RND transporter [Candidatus Thiodiazotropha sp. (ex Lucinoma borealis)]|nr:RND transporter [Candidatus Thiodiazotropha sp. (ex Lucinoma borealis)]